MKNIELVNFIIKNNIDYIGKILVSGWDHYRPGIGFLNDNGEEIAAIFDEALISHSDGMYCSDENGNFVSANKNDYDDKNPAPKNIFKIHRPTCHVYMSHYRNFYAKKNNLKMAKKKKIEKTCGIVNDWLLHNSDSYIEVFYRKNGRWCRNHCEQFIKDLWKTIRPDLKEALKNAKEIRRAKETVKKSKPTTLIFKKAQALLREFKLAQDF